MPGVSLEARLTQHFWDVQLPRARALSVGVLVPCCV